MNRTSQILHEYHLRFRSLRESPEQPDQGFSGASVIRMTGEFGDLALRKWPTARLSSLRLSSLHALLEHVFQSGVTEVAVPIRNIHQQTLTEISGNLWQLEPWMPGSADFHDDPTDDRLQAAMHCLARWHLSAAEFRCPPNANEWFYFSAAGVAPACVERSRKLQQWLNHGLAQIQQALPGELDSEFQTVAESIVAGVRKVGPQVLSDLQHGTTIMVPLQPCLRDVWHDHVLFDGEDVTGLIDPASCRTENVASDLSRLLGSFVGSDRNRFQAAVDWYSQRRPLSDSERWLVEVLDRSSVVLSSLNWLGRRYTISGKAEQPVPWDRVLVRLQNFDQRLRVLAG